jgi:osmotically inducible protein OsmC
MATVRQAKTRWEGSLQDGAGKVTLASSGLGTYDVSWPARAEEPNGKTSPEELIAAAHSACYAMQLSANIAEAGGTPESLDVSADVSLGPDKDNGGFKLTGITLKVRGEVTGLDADGFAKAAEAAKAGCPVSKALTGVEITLDAALES